MSRILIRIAQLTAVSVLIIACIGALYLKFAREEPVWDERNLRKPTVPISVEYGEDFSAPSKYAIKVWNDIMPKDQPLFTPRPSSGNVVRVLSANGEPCGEFSLHETKGHSATSYQCPDGTWEIHISYPGDTHTQLCIVAHELGHVLGLADDSWGTRVMNNQLKKCPDVVRVSDRDAAAVAERYIDVH